MNKYTGYHYMHDKIMFDDKEQEFGKLKSTKMIDVVSEKLEKYKNRILELGKKYSKNKDILSYEEKIIDLSSSFKKSEKEIVFETKTKQYKEFVKTLCCDIYGFLNDYINDDIFDNLDYFVETIEDFIKRLNFIKYINKFSKIEENVVIIGGNGSGKSSFASLLKQVYSNDMLIIPAQKLLLYDGNDYNIMNTNKSDIDSMYEQNIIEMHRNFTTSLSSDSSTYRFSKDIKHLVKSEFEEWQKIIDNSNLPRNLTLLEKINEICKNSLNIKFKINVDNLSVDAINERKEKYGINSMSDGEKAFLLYTIEILLLAKRNSYIIIDEPESHLNPAVYKKMWDALENIRSDCQFIYISHDIEFVVSRNNDKVFWMKKYQYPSSWEMEQLPINDEIPKELWIDIYGSKNKILFCEGDKGSMDYELYNSLFGKKYTVIPVSSCEEVKKYTKAFNNSKSIHNNEAIGIIDGDNKTEHEKEKLKKAKIYFTKFNEIEMLLCDEKIIKEVLKNKGKYKTNLINDTKEIKNKIFELFSKNRENIKLDILKHDIEYILNNKSIKSKKISELSNELQKTIDNINLSDRIKEVSQNVDNIVINKDYDELLKTCNLKNMIENQAINEYVKNYYKQAISIIKNKLTKYVKNKYFKDID